MDFHFARDFSETDKVAAEMKTHIITGNEKPTGGEQTPRAPLREVSDREEVGGAVGSVLNPSKTLRDADFAHDNGVSAVSHIITHAQTSVLSRDSPRASPQEVSGGKTSGGTHNGAVKSGTKNAKPKLTPPRPNADGASKARGMRGMSRPGVWGRREGGAAGAAGNSATAGTSATPGTFSKRPGTTQAALAASNKGKQPANSLRQPSRSYADMAAARHPQQPQQVAQGPQRARPVWRESEEKCSVIVSCAGINMAPADLALYIEAKMKPTALKFDWRTTSFEVGLEEGTDLDKVIAEGLEWKGRIFAIEKPYTPQEEFFDMETQGRLLLRKFFRRKTRKV